MVGYYIISILIIIVNSVLIYNLIKAIIKMERSRYVYWDEDELKIKTYEEIQNSK